MRTPRGTYCPDNPGDGTSMNILFYDGQIEGFFDHIQVFDGDDTSAPQVGRFDGRLPRDVGDGDQSRWLFDGAVYF